VVSIDSETHRVNVHTQKGQKLVLDMSPALLKAMRIGAQIMRVAPQQPA